MHAIDHYIKLRAQKDAKMDSRLETLLNNMFQRCIEDQQYRHAIGIALETHRMDWFKEAIMTSVSGMLVTFGQETGFCLVFPMGKVIIVYLKDLEIIRFFLSGVAYVRNEAYVMKIP